MSATIDVAGLRGMPKQIGAVDESRIPGYQP
ncbi:MAG: hypothetical protein K0S03_188 [Burkholderiales bacterium]|nr:hypothetical protein [Burkholderiales bacterium]